MSFIKHKWAITPSITVPACLVVTEVRRLEEVITSYRLVRSDLPEGGRTKDYPEDQEVDRVTVTTDVFAGDEPTGERLDHCMYALALTSDDLRGLDRDVMLSAVESSLLELPEFEGAKLVKT